MIVIDKAHAERVSRTGATDTYRAANGHLMIAPVRHYPKDEAGQERDFLPGDRIVYDSWAAYCAPECNHLSPPEDW